MFFPLFRFTMQPTQATIATGFRTNCAWYLNEAIDPDLADLADPAAIAKGLELMTARHLQERREIVDRARVAVLRCRKTPTTVHMCRAICRPFSAQKRALVKKWSKFTALTEAAGLRPKTEMCRQTLAIYKIGTRWTVVGPANTLIPCTIVGYHKTEHEHRVIELENGNRHSMDILALAPP